MKKKIVFISLALIAACYAGENDGATGMAFLKIGVGARSGGMGEAQVAAANDAMATYWNPAGLLAADRSNLALMYNTWLASVNSQFGAVQFRGKTASLAFHVYSLSVDDIPVRDFPTTEPLENTGANYLSLGVSYARPLMQSLDAGITLKYLFEKIFAYTANGYAVDLGLRYRMMKDKFILGGSIQNLGSMSELDQEATKLPSLVRVGAAYDLSGLTGGTSVLLAGDLLKPLEEDLRVHLGVEVGVLQQLMLRAGYMNGYDNRTFSFGAGINKTSFRIDYSYMPFSENLGESQRIALMISI